MTDRPDANETTPENRRLQLLMDQLQGVVQAVIRVTQVSNVGSLIERVEDRSGPAPGPGGGSPDLAGRAVFVHAAGTDMAPALRHLFEEKGCVRVGPARSQAETLEMARTAAMDAAVLDAGADGTACREVAALLRGRGIPYVICADPQVAALDAALNAGSLVLVKPFVPEALSTSLTVALRRRPGAA